MHFVITLLLFLPQAYLWLTGLPRVCDVVLADDALPHHGLDFASVELHGRIAASEEELHLTVRSLVKLLHSCPVLPEGAERGDACSWTYHYDRHVALLGQPKVGCISNESIHILAHGNVLEEGAADAIVGSTCGCRVL